MKDKNIPSEEQKMEAYYEFIQSDMIHKITIPAGIRMDLSLAKEHLIAFMWEPYIKGEIYRLEMAGIPADELLECISAEELLEGFAHYQVGYWEGVNEAKKDEEDDFLSTE